MILLSYILPIFGTDEYISDCLDSIYAQDLPESEFEVICVDDCSQDKSRDIIKQYKQAHGNLLLIEHKINKGAGGARNTGIAVANGQYVWFVDSDDTISLSAAQIILGVCTQRNLDVLCFNYTVNNIDKEDDTFVFKTELPVWKGISFIESLWSKSLIFNLGYPWRSVYSRQMLLDAHIRFAENMPYGEETTFMMEAIANAERVTAIPTILYHYRQNATQVSTCLRKGRGDIIYYSTIGAGELIVRWRDEIVRKSESIAYSLDKGLPWFVNRLFIQLLRTNHHERKAFYWKIEENAPSEKLVSYMNGLASFVVKHPRPGLMVLDILSIAYRLKHAEVFNRNTAV